jgi:hypothetical protein
MTADGSQISLLSWILFSSQRSGARVDMSTVPEDISALCTVEIGSERTEARVLDCVDNAFETDDDASSTNLPSAPQRCTSSPGASTPTPKCPVVRLPEV